MKWKLVAVFLGILVLAMPSALNETILVDTESETSFSFSGDELPYQGNKFAYSGNGLAIIHHLYTSWFNTTGGNTIELRFSTRYNITGNDIGYILFRPSSDAEWRVLEKLSGLQEEWTTKSYVYDLSSYNNIQLSFTFFTDCYSTSEGWWVDNINITSLDLTELFSEDFEDYNVGDIVDDWIIVGNQSEFEISVLTHNLMLLPFLVPQLATYIQFLAKAVNARTSAISTLLDASKPNCDWAKKYDIFCFQEVFHTWTIIGSDFGAPTHIGRGFLGNPALSLDFNTVAGARHWFNTGKTRTVTLNPGTADKGTVDILNAAPSAKCQPSQIAIVKTGNSYIVAGPDSTSHLSGKRIASYSGGLMILSKYPVIAASGYIHEDSSWHENTFTNKGALYARIQLDPKNPKSFIHVFNVHLVARENNKEKRSKQVDNLILFMKSCIATEDDNRNPIILCGDFNIIAGIHDEYGSLLRKMRFSIPSRVIEDLWAKLKPFNLPACDSGTWVGKDIVLPKGSPWGPQGWNNVLATEKGNYERIDYIFTFPGKEGTSPIKLKPKSIEREPPTTRSKPWVFTYGPPYMPRRITSYVVSDHIGVGAKFIVE